MIVMTHNSGLFSEHFLGRIRYANVWHGVMSQSGSLKFYGEDTKLVVDVLPAINGKDLEIISYPHNDKENVLKIATKNEARLQELYDLYRKSNSIGLSVTMDLAGEIKIVSPKDFSRYSPSAKATDEIFYFESTKPGMGFPNLYLIEISNSKSENAYILNILARSSRTIFPPATKPTDLGKEFTFMLLDAGFHRELKKTHANLVGVKFPTTNGTDIPMFLKTDAFQDIVGASHPEALKSIDGKIVLDKDYNPKDVEILEEGLDFEYTEEEQGYFQKNKEHVLKSIAEKDTVGLTDISISGFEEVLSWIPISDKIIPIVCDMPGLVKRMCIFQGSYHVVAEGKEQLEDFCNLTGLDEENLVVCSDETFPKYMPLAPNS